MFYVAKYKFNNFCVQIFLKTKMRFQYLKSNSIFINHRKNLRLKDQFYDLPNGGSWVYLNYLQII